MSETGRDDAAKAPQPSVDPTVQVERPPLPGRAVRAQLAAGQLSTPPFRRDDATVTVNGPAPTDAGRTQELNGPAPVQVRVGPRPRSGRRWRTWPYIVAVVLALVILGVVLLVMLWRGATIDGGVQFLGAVGATSGGWIEPGGG